MKVPKHTRTPKFGIPVLRGFTSADRRQINVYCPNCNEFHSHGWNPDNPTWAIERRAAHCTKGNKYKTYMEGIGETNEYYIGEITKELLKNTNK
jgi:hypothetical protein